MSIFFFFFNDTATTEIYTLSLHDALPISHQYVRAAAGRPDAPAGLSVCRHDWRTECRPDRVDHLELRCANRGDILDRKSTRLNSSHTVISYAVFCLKKKKNKRDSPFLARI